MHWNRKKLKSARCYINYQLGSVMYQNYRPNTFSDFTTVPMVLCLLMFSRYINFVTRKKFSDEVNLEKKTWNRHIWKGIAVLYNFIYWGMKTVWNYRVTLFNMYSLKSDDANCLKISIEREINWVDFPFSSEYILEVMPGNRLLIGSILFERDFDAQANCLHNAIRPFHEKYKVTKKDSPWGSW